MARVTVESARGLLSKPVQKKEPITPLQLYKLAKKIGGPQTSLWNPYLCDCFCWYQTKTPRTKTPGQNPLDKNPLCQKPPGQKPPRQNILFRNFITFVSKLLHCLTPFALHTDCSGKEVSFHLCLI